MVNLCVTGVVVEVAMVVGTGAETILVQIDIITEEIIHVHTEKTSALSVLCTKKELWSDEGFNYIPFTGIVL